MSDTKYQVGDVIGTVTLVVDFIDEDGDYCLRGKETSIHDLADIWAESDLDELAVQLDPSKRKEYLLKQRAEIDKQLEELSE